ncbi:hypothetical protein NKI25_35515 [Mesorhizobium sp. M0808]|uniref:hypothetical protein n=1 Tax=Mesorhizobium sp. M0808 TaxID=2957002 RepID=UPI003335ACB4
MDPEARRFFQTCKARYLFLFHFSGKIAINVAQPFAIVKVPNMAGIAMDDLVVNLTLGTGVVWSALGKEKRRSRRAPERQICANSGLMHRSEPVFIPSFGSGEYLLGRQFNADPGYDYFLRGSSAGLM